MTKQILIAVLVFVLVGCDAGKEYANQSVEFLVNEQLNKAVFSEFHRGNETLYFLNETAQDKSELQRSAYAQILLITLNRIDSLVRNIGVEVTEIKESMIQDKSIPKVNKKQGQNFPLWTPLNLSLEKSRLFKPKNGKVKLIELKQKLAIFRGNLISSFIVHENENSEQYFFKDPNIQSVNSNKNILKVIDKAIEKSHLSNDDTESVKKIYLNLTQLLTRIPSEINEPIDYLNMLLSIEREILSARADALNIIRTRRCVAEYRIDTFLPIIDCPEICFVEDSLEMKAFMGSYYSFQDLTVMVNGKTFETVKDGIAYQKLIIPKKKVLVLNGTMTVRNKSGVRKVVPWQKKIKILPKELKTAK